MNAAQTPEQNCGSAEAGKRQRGRFGHIRHGEIVIRNSADVAGLIPTEITPRSIQMPAVDQAAVGAGVIKPGSAAIQRDLQPGVVGRSGFGTGIRDANQKIKFAPVGSRPRR